MQTSSDTLYHKLKQLRGNVERDRQLAPLTTLRIGGPAAILFEPAAIDELQTALCLLHRTGCDYFVLGNGSNLLVADAGFPGVVLRLGAEFEYIHEAGKGRLVVGGGTGLNRLLRFACEHGLTGLEFAAGIPATLAGACVMNAGGCYGTIADVFRRGRVVSSCGELQTLRYEEMNFNYRCSRLQNTGEVLYEVEIGLEYDRTEVIREKMKKIAEERRKLQPLAAYSAGSVFKNHACAPAGYLIDKAGLKGLSSGGARVSDLHANFITTDGNASAEDVICLMRRVRRIVYERYGICLEPEIEFVGFNGSILGDDGNE